MVRSYKIETDRGNKNSNEKLQYAIHLMTADNFSLREAARNAGVNKSALCRFCKRKYIGYVASHLAFDAASEAKLVEYLITFAHMNYGLTMEEARRLAYSFVSAKNISVTQSLNENKIVEKDWFLNFMERNPALSLKKPEATNLARSTAFNKHTSYEASWSGYFWRKRHLSLPCCISTEGNSIPPTFIWPRKTERNLKSYMTNSPTGSLGLVHESGWMTASNFNKWMAHFISFSKPFKESPVLLILDNHQSHLSYEAIEMAKENNVVLLIFPPHVTNHLQPLDESVYELLKK
ncbi:uncharacterized protein [Watersipora subatra]|uniref:uncharacterized protein n=1 Tax=Watersipora subatra TaxID=2589382 RepID=UPI00355C2565